MHVRKVDCRQIGKQVYGNLSVVVARLANCLPTDLCQNFYSKHDYMCGEPDTIIKIVVFLYK